MKYKLVLKMVTILSIITSSLLLGLFLSTKLNMSFFNWFRYVGFIALPLLPVNIILGLWLAISRRWIAVLPIAALALNFNCYAGVMQLPPSKKEAAPTKSIKLMTYNVHNFKNSEGSTLPEISSYLRQQGVDIVCFQEYLEGYQFKADSMRKIFFNFGYVATGFTIQTEKHDYGMAIYSKYPILDSGVIDLGTSNGNGAMWADVNVDGDTVKIITAHLQTTGVSQSEQKFRKEGADGAGLLMDLIATLDRNTKVRIEQAKTILEVIDNSPYEVILCGDFNDTPFSNVYNMLTSKMKDGFKEVGSGYTYTFRRFQMMRIDYIMYNGKLKGITNLSPDLEYSDHNPVVMTIGIK